MFCTSCGKDCGEFKFCSNCGRQVQDEINLHDEQINCSNSDNQIELKEESDLNCEVKKLEEYLKPPFIEKSVLRGDLIFGAQEVKLMTRLPRMQKATYIFPYDEIFDVTYVPATRWFTGFLCIRDWKNRFVALPKRQGQKNCMDSMIWFEERDNVIFYRAYEFLKQCAAINTEQKKSK